MSLDDKSFSQILEFHDLSWRGYRRVRKGVKKRIARHMQDCGSRTVKDYLLLLRDSPDLMEEARELLTVSVSRFFRDSRLWEVLDRYVIPKLVTGMIPVERPAVRAWSAGCACGEEAYSLKILWNEAEIRLPAIPPIEILATDNNHEVLQKGRRGIYTPSSLKNVSARILRDYFTPVSGGFAIRESLKEGICWLKHDFISETPPTGTFDLIFLRNNLLTYYGPPVKTSAFSRVLNALRVGGFLIIGNNEEILSIEEMPLKSCPEYRCIFELVKPVHDL